MRPLSREELLALPPVTNLPTLGRALGLSEPVIRERARRGDLEALGIRVLRLGAQYRIPTEDILRILGVRRDIDASGGPALAGPPDAITDQLPAKEHSRANSTSGR